MMEDDSTLFRITYANNVKNNLFIKETKYQKNGNNGTIHINI